MPPKKTTAKKPAAKKEPEPGPQVEVPGGFRLVDYEGLDQLVCERCGFNTFDVGSAKAHLREHTITDTNAQELAELTEHLSEHAQVTTTEEPSE